MSILKENLVIAYIKGEEERWKFLCKQGKYGELEVVYDYYRKNDMFVGIKFSNILYTIRDATREDIDEVILESI